MTDSNLAVNINNLPLSKVESGVAVERKHIDQIAKEISKIHSRIVWNKEYFNKGKLKTYLV